MLPAENGETGAAMVILEADEFSRLCDAIDAVDANLAAERDHALQELARVIGGDA